MYKKSWTKAGKLLEHYMAVGLQIDDLTFEQQMATSGHFNETAYERGLELQRSSIAKWFFLYGDQKFDVFQQLAFPDRGRK